MNDSKEEHRAGYQALRKEPPCSRQLNAGAPVVSWRSKKCVRSSGGRWGRDHLSVLDRQRSAGFEGRAQRTLFVFKAIGYVIADELLRGLVDGLAAPFGRRNDVLVLHAFLPLVSGI